MSDEECPTVLLSYDVSGSARSTAVRVCHLVFGRGKTEPTTPPPYILRPGVVWIGQSVLLLPRPLGNELASRLRALGARVSTAPVRIAPADLRAFQRGSRESGGAGTPPQGSSPRRTVGGP